VDEIHDTFSALLLSGHSTNSSSKNCVRKNKNDKQCFQRRFAQISTVKHVSQSV